MKFQALVFPRTLCTVTIEQMAEIPRRACIYAPNYLASYPKHCCVNCHFCENLKYHSCVCG